MADNDTNVNLVKNIPEDKQKEIAKEINSQTQYDLDSRRGWEDKRNKWQKLWACRLDKKSNPWPNSSNVCVPMLAVACNQFHARIYQALFAPNDIVKAIPVASNDIKRSENVAGFMNWQLQFEMEEFEEVTDKSMLQLPVNGSVFKKILWNASLDRPLSSYISPLDLILPYRTRSLEEARRITHRLYLHYDELFDRNEMDLYENFDQLSTEGYRIEENDHRDTADELMGITDISAGDTPHIIYETHKSYDLGNGKKEPYIFTVDKATGTLMRATSRRFHKGSQVIDLNYFTDYHFIPNTDGFYSFGLGHFLEQLNYMANTAFNQIFDAGRLTNQPFGFYGRRAGIKAKKMKLYPGVMNPVEDATQIFFPSMQRMDNVLFSVLGLIQQYEERLTSVTDNILGREQAGVERPTKGGTEAKIEQGLMVFNILFKRVFRSFKKELKLVKALNEIHLKESKQYRVMGSQNKIAFSDLKKDDFNGVKDIIPVGDPAYASRMQKRLEAYEIYQLLLANPLIGGVPESQQFQPNPRAIYTVTSNLLDTFPNLKNREQILPEIPEESIPPEIENSMFMQGDVPEPKPGENHIIHLQIHKNFMTKDIYKGLKKEYKDRLQEHISQTVQLLNTEVNQREALGGGVNV